MLAPIVLFVYNRPWHTKQTLESLMENALSEQSALFIYADGPKENANQEDMKKIEEVRKIIREEQWCKEVHIIETEQNKGVDASVIFGVSEIVNKFGKIIILEDDIVTSRGFLKYMNDALNLYENEEKVMHIGAHIPFLKVKLPETYFLNLTFCWGWATWQRAWKYYNPDAKDLLERLKQKNDIHRFNMDGGYDYFKLLLKNVNLGLTNWDIRWYTSVFLMDGFSLLPSRAMVNNIGFDNSGVHCGENDIYDKLNLADKINVQAIALIKSDEAGKALAKFYKELKPTLFKRLLCKIKPGIESLINKVN